MAEFSDHLVFVDESGDHSLESIDPDFPLFALSFCIIRKDVYSDFLTPHVRGLKFATFGHDMVVLHENDIRKRKGAFAQLGKEVREAFLNDLTDLIQQTDFTLVAVVIDKRKLKSQYTTPEHPYHLAMEFGLERIHGFLKTNGQDGRLTYLICEARGAKEDKDLELAFRRQCSGGNYRRETLPFEIIIADKKTNSEGLQVADLTARPIALSYLRPDQPNRAMEVLEHKFYRSLNGSKIGYGLKCFP